MLRLNSGSSVSSRVSVSSKATSSLGIGVTAKTIRENKIDPPKEHVETEWKANEGYDWVDIEVGGEDDLFIMIKNQMEGKVKEAGRTNIPNLQELEVDIHGKGKEASVGHSIGYGDKPLDISELEGPLIRMRKGVSIDLGRHELKELKGDGKRKLVEDLATKKKACEEKHKSWVDEKKK
ncbi:hypothetical protein LR48_Vigan03g200600 [Vigna angularis]|uniref:Uncharacterized protein n=1 Tax=Phaseolus angularis TaxID=3914 RepID=A0A0L9U836_PHAAN|nr:hypothetical protein LR48_Vigan03g200600 [Vigna angularis]